MVDHSAIAASQHTPHRLEKKWNILQLIFTISYLCLPILGMKTGRNERKENVILRLEWEFEVEVIGLNYFPL